MNDIVLIIFKVLVILFSVVLHEVSHGFMAYSLGDTTAKDAGRLTLNPLKHLDLFGSIFLPLITLMLGGFVFGYAKPVPYNPLNLRDRRYGPAKVAIAGPLVNLSLAVLFGLFLRFLPTAFDATIMPDLLSFIVMMNLVLGIFNLIPIPPLDGHWLLLTFLPSSFNAIKVFIMRYGIILFIFFIFFLFPIIAPLISFLFRVIVG